MNELLCVCTRNAVDFMQEQKKSKMFFRVFFVFSALCLFVEAQWDTEYPDYGANYVDFSYGS